MVSVASVTSSQMFESQNRPCREGINEKPSKKSMVDSKTRPSADGRVFFGVDHGTNRPMKNLFALLVIFSSSAAFSAPRFYACKNFEDAKVGIDLHRAAAAYTNPDGTTMLRLKRTDVLNTFPPQTVLVFEDKHQELSLRFNVSTLTASVFANGPQDILMDLGESSCEAEL